ASCSLSLARCDAGQNRLSARHSASRRAPTEGLMDRSPATLPRIDMAVVAWAVLVFGLLFLGLLPLYVLHLDLAKLAANSSGAPPIVLVGILFTASTPPIPAL